MRFFPLIFISLFIAACSGSDNGMSTRGETPVPPSVPAVPIAKKPTNCSVDFSQTCWSRTVAKVTNCLKKEKDGSTDIFSTDREFCSNPDTEKLIHFQSPADMFINPINMLHNQTTAMNFKVYPDSINECFSVSGTKDNFVVHLKTGETVGFKFDQKEMAFNCLDGQNVSIAAARINGCQNVMPAGEFSAQVPGFVFEPIIENGAQKGWTFRFGGAPESPDVFKCYYP